LSAGLRVRPGGDDLVDAIEDVVGELGELAGCLEFVLVPGQVEVESVGQSLAGDRCGSLGGAWW
jgi:hypothetical protein